jgi:hypothetical protein
MSSLTEAATARYLGSAVGVAAFSMITNYAGGAS